MTSTWNRKHDLKFGDERTRPSIDLAAAVKLVAPKLIVDWISSIGLRPFLNPLNDVERTDFSAELHGRVQQAYSTRGDGKVLFPFRRMFVVAYR